MEEVWNDINLSSLHHHCSSSNTTTAQNFHFQDFFSKPSLSYKDPTRPNDVSSTGHAIFLGLGSLPKRPSFATTTTTTPACLSLNSESELGFRFLETRAPLVKNPALDSPPAYKKKRVQQNSEDFSDLKHKRLMKNRESAARSRARKQAYTNELEHEVAHLRKENARLRNQLTEFSLAAPTDVSKKRTLCRTLTAPF